MSPAAPLAPDAAMALGLASTALPFARTPADEVERWLRVLRLHGEVGIALQALGVSEVPLTDADSVERRAAGEASSEHRDSVALVTERALRVAWERRARALATTDVLIAVMDVYGDDFDQVLQAHGTDRSELLQRLGISRPLAGSSPS
jgi:hypothetical protein